MRFGNSFSIGIAASLLGVCTKTLRRWDKSGKLHPAYRTPGNHRRYDRSVIISIIRGRKSSASITYNKMGVNRHTAIYGRVSASRQRKSGDLDRQVNDIKEYCSKNGYHVRRIYKDVGSGLNDNRKGLLKLLRDCSAGIFDVVVVNYNDRLARFGLRIIREYLMSWGVRLEVINPVIVQPSAHAELITDLTSILYSFMGKLYRLRRK